MAQCRYDIFNQGSPIIPANVDPALEIDHCVSLIDIDRHLIDIFYGCEWDDDQQQFKCLLP